MKRGRWKRGKVGERSSEDSGREGGGADPGPQEAGGEQMGRWLGGEAPRPVSGGGSEGQPLDADALLDVEQEFEVS